MDFDQVSDREALVRNYFSAQKNLWNNKHNIVIHGHEVESYVQDSKEPHYASGVYSVLHNKWLVKPSPMTGDFDKQEVKSKAKNIMEIIDGIEAMAAEEGRDSDAVVGMTDRLLAKLKAARSEGLSSAAGEYAPENLVYKILRRTGYLQKLWDLEPDLYDKDMSIAEEKIGTSKNGAPSYFQMGSSLPDKLYNQDSDTGKATRDPGIRDTDKKKTMKKESKEPTGPRSTTFYFKIGDQILFGKYKNKKGKVVGFGKDDKGSPTMDIESISKGKKKKTTMGLYRMWLASVKEKAS